MKNVNPTVAKYKRRLFLKLLILAVVIFAVVSVVKKKTEDKSYYEGEPIVNAIDEADREEYEQRMKEEESDIEGMSKWDKIEMGLMPQNGSDSDSDGLTDKEEIEVYHSDPLKKSTSGDLYSDYYKVKHDMDIDKEYEYEGEPEFPYNKCKEVTLEADSIYDLNAEVTTFSSADVEDFDVLIAYEVNSYVGDMTVDLSNILKKNDVSAEDLMILTGPELFLGKSDTKKADYELDGDTAIINIEGGCIVYIGVPTGKVASLKGNVVGFESFLDFALEDEEPEPEALVCWCPLATIIFHNIKVSYVDLKDDTLNNNLLNTMRTAVSNFDNSDCYTTNGSTAQTSEAIQTKYNTLKRLLPIFEWDGGIDYPWYQIFFAYTTYDNIADRDWNDDAWAKMKKKNDENLNEDGSLTFGVKDELPITNFSSEKGGNCAGISYYTMQLYNNGKVTKKGEYAGYNFDLAEHKRNETLLDKGLSDYKIKSGSDFSRYAKKDITKLYDYEQEFVKMIFARQQAVNDVVNINDYLITPGKTAYDMSLVHQMTKRLDRGEVLCAGFGMADGKSFHMVNIYGYHRMDTKKKELSRYVFDVYDCNHPDWEEADNDRMEHCYLLVTIYSDGHIAWLYSPYWDNDKKKGELSTTNLGYSDQTCMVILDTDLNILNNTNKNRDITNEDEKELKW